MRIKDRDIEAAIFRPRITNPENDKISTHDVLVFTTMGKHDELINLDGQIDKNGYPSLCDGEIRSSRELIPADQRREAYAKIIKRGARIKYYVKANTNGGLINPNSMFSDEQNFVNKHNIANNVMGDFKEVTETVFIHYIKFLKTLNKAHLLLAERGQT